MSADYGTVTMRREQDPADPGRNLIRITQADETALIAPQLIGHMFAGAAHHLRLDGDRLTISDDFGEAVIYRIGEYVHTDSGAGFALRREAVRAAKDKLATKVKETA